MADVQLTVDISAATNTCIDELVGFEELSEADVINRAIQVYAYMVELKKAGARIFYTAENGDPADELTELKWS